MKILTPEAKYSFQLQDDLEAGDLEDSSKVVKESWVENVYQLNEGLFSSGGVFVDLGANIGAVSIKVASFNDDRVENNFIRVLAVEPEENNLRMLDENVRANDKVGQVKIVSKGVMGEPGEFPISNRGGNSNVFDQGRPGSGRADFVTLEQLFEDNEVEEADVLKMDIEGAEFGIIEQTPIEVWRQVGFLTMEFTGCKPQKFGRAVAKLSQVFNLHTIGQPRQGGYIYGRRYKI